MASRAAMCPWCLSLSLLHHLAAGLAAEQALLGWRPAARPEL